MNVTQTAGLIALLLGAGCYDDSKLINALCENGEDCWHTQTCVRTPTQSLLNLQGFCRENSDCAEGEQPGCACGQDQGSAAYTCIGFGELVPTPPGVDAPNECLCCPLCESGMMAVIEDNSDKRVCGCEEMASTT